MAIADHKKAGHALPVGTRCVVRVGVMTVPAKGGKMRVRVYFTLPDTDGDIVA